MVASTGEIGSSLLFEVDRLYAKQQMQLDIGDIDGFGASFTEDATFALGAGDSVPGGREGIVAVMRGLVERFQAAKVHRHHWFGMRRLEQEDDGAIRAVYYAIVSHTSSEGVVTMDPSSVVTDHLVRTADGTLAVRSRRIVLDRA
jgi:hypothetical protein